MFKPLVVVVVVVVLFLVGPSVVSVGGFASENNRNIRFAVLASVSSRPSVRPSRRRGLWNGVAPPERVGTEKRADEFGAYPLQCATPGHGPRIDMAASVGEYIAYSVGAFLACVSRVRSATRDARRDATRRERSGAVLVPLWLCVNIKNTERGRDDATDDARTNERARWRC
jgi:hypothetical protein